MRIDVVKGRSVRRCPRGPSDGGRVCRRPRYEPAVVPLSPGRRAGGEGSKILSLYACSWEAPHLKEGFNLTIIFSFCLTHFPYLVLGLLVHSGGECGSNEDFAVSFYEIIEIFPKVLLLVENPIVIER